MLAIGVDLLADRYVATAFNDRESAEWPPHPARLFSALVATWADGVSEDEASRQALEWLARQPAPRVIASASDEVAHRSVMTVFVPVNDVSVIQAPDRSKLDEAQAAVAAAVDDKARAKASKEVAKQAAKLAAATAKAIAAPTKSNKSDAAAGAAVLPETRTRQPRTFPSATPKHPRVLFVWPDASPTDETRDRLHSIATSVVRLGHSSSFVAARVCGEAELPALSSGMTTYREDPDQGAHVLRWVGPQQLDSLQRAFALHQETEPRVLPAVFVTYGEGEPIARVEPRSSLFDPSLVVLARVGGVRLPITAAPGVARQLRRALMAVLKEDVPQLLSGHAADGSPSDQPHLAIVPLPVVGGAHADGALVGVALVFPSDADPAERRRVLSAVARLGRERIEGSPSEIALHLGDAGTLELQLVSWGEDPRTTLRPGWWTRPSRTWATATPIALDRNPGDLHAPSRADRAAAFEAAERSVAAAAERIGLPAPTRVEVLRSAVLSGTAKPRAHGRFPLDTLKPQRVLVHARVDFGELVRGPVILGAGRFQGMGLCLPIDEAAEAAR